MMSSRPLNRAQVRELDRRAIEEYGIPGLILMENAGRNAARAIRHILAGMIGTPAGARAAIVCGGGNNAGDGFVIARHLMNVGVDVMLDLAVDPARLAGDAAVNYAIARRMGIPMRDIRDPAAIAAAGTRWKDCHVVVDALLGTGFSGAVRAPLDAVIRAINETRVARAGDAGSGLSSENARPLIVAIDLPSGLDADTGTAGGVAVRADVTVTMAAAKIGFGAPTAADYTGRIVVVDIGAPSRLFEDLRL